MVKRGKNHPCIIIWSMCNECETTSEVGIAVMQSLGVSQIQEDFFASSVTFTNSRTGDAETDKQVFFRHQIWLVRMQGETLGLKAEVPAWMEQSLMIIAAWQDPKYQKSSWILRWKERLLLSNPILSAAASLSLFT